MMSPLLWMTIPLEDEDAWLDFLHTHDMHHRELAKVARLPFAALDDLRTQTDRHAQLHDALARFFGIAEVPDLRSFDLRDREHLKSFLFLNAQDHVRLAALAGVQ